jgi:hypothetical protein
VALYMSVEENKTIVATAWSPDPGRAVGGAKATQPGMAKSAAFPAR